MASAIYFLTKTDILSGKSTIYRSKKHALGPSESTRTSQHSSTRKSKKQAPTPDECRCADNIQHPQETRNSLNGSTPTARWQHIQRP